LDESVIFVSVLSGDEKVVVVVDGTVSGGSFVFSLISVETDLFLCVFLVKK
jgi:hypothetical protein